MPILASPRSVFCSIAVGLLLAATLACCANPPADPTERTAFEQNNDPLEPLNRNIFEFNQFVDRMLIGPVAEAYVAVVPEPGRDAIHRVLDNMMEPTLFFNNVLQGEFERAAITLGRFTANTSLGLGGFLDPAATWGLERQPADFGQTLYVWGFPQGPYLILPLLGPSNPRDAIGISIDSYANPFTILATTYGLEEWTNARLITNGIDQRARVMDVLDDLQKNSVDFYAELRSLTQQRRAAELHGGTAPDPGADFYRDPDAAPAPAKPTASATPGRPNAGKKRAPTGSARS